MGFKLSMVLRNVHTTLTEEYQFPYWVSYVAFAVATILLGGILGLILVCCIDCVYPPRRDDELHHHVQQATRPDKKDSDVKDEDVSQDDVSQGEGSQNESQGEESPRAENKTRR